jgi:hypothetical protein
MERRTVFAGNWAYSLRPVGGRPNLKACANPRCDHWVGISVQYCCAACGDAHVGRYEIHETGPLAHAPRCLDRHLERGPRE